MFSSLIQATRFPGPNHGACHFDRELWRLWNSVFYTCSRNGQILMVYRCCCAGYIHTEMGLSSSCMECMQPLLRVFFLYLLIPLSIRKSQPGHLRKILLEASLLLKSKLTNTISNSLLPFDVSLNPLYHSANRGVNVQHLISERQPS